MHTHVLKKKVNSIFLLYRNHLNIIIIILNTYVVVVVVVVHTIPFAVSIILID